jgi:beta-glucosidase
MRGIQILCAGLVATVVAGATAMPRQDTRPLWTNPALAHQDTRPWMNLALSPDRRAELLEAAMTQAERIAFVHGFLGAPSRGVWPPGALGSAGFVPAIPRLDVPALQESDASLGVANPFQIRSKDRATALPSSLALAASFDPAAAYAGGAMIGQEAWRQGFNVLLAGGVNLAREPRNGRNFEYLGEDPLLAGTLDAESVRGIQDQHVISTVKHFAMNDQETGRFWANAVIDEAAMRESDLLAFELAIEGGHPGSVMCAYNLVNGVYSCGNDMLLDGVLKTDWGFPGFVMSDWGAVHETQYANAGLDQESAANVDAQIYFGQPLANAIAAGSIPSSRLSAMVRRILRSMFAEGLFEHPPERTPIDFKADADVAQKIAAEGIVLLKNQNNILPLNSGVKRIAVIGGRADAGVISGGGSSQVIPAGGAFISVPIANVGMIYDPDPPLLAIRAKAAGTMVRFADGRYLSTATEAAKWADVAIVFANQWMSEGVDAPDLTLPSGQDQLIAAVAAANPKTIVVLETGGPVVMPWLDSVSGVLEAWYPGSRGGQSIADVLFGEVDPSGHLAITFPADLSQNPRPQIPGSEVASRTLFNVPYTEGADIGYRWFAKQNLKPLFPFGFGLSYTSFDFKNLQIIGNHTLMVGFDVTNTGNVAGSAVPQVYITSAAGEATQRLIGYSRITLPPGQTTHVSITADPRLLAHYDVQAHAWRVAQGTYDVMVGRSASDSVLTGSAQVMTSLIKP